MNNFITAKQFLGQSEKVQRKLIKWWKNNLRKGCLYIYMDYLTCVGVTGSIIDETHGIIPLLQVHQLIQFIEEETGGKVEIEYIEYEKILITISEIIYDECFKKVIFKFKEDYLCDLLQALWQVTIRLIESEN